MLKTVPSVPTPRAFQSSSHDGGAGAYAKSGCPVIPSNFTIALSPLLSTPWKTKPPRKSGKYTAAMAKATPG